MLPEVHTKGLLETQKEISRKWILTAFPATSPSPWRDTIVCIDDCPNCPLWNKGCAGKASDKDESGKEGAGCNRWNDLICKDCPCLGSKYSDLWGSQKLVDGNWTLEETVEFVEKDGKKRSTWASLPLDEKLARIRRIRKDMEDGEVINGDINMGS